MALFRLCRGTLEDSLSTTVIVHTINEIKEAVKQALLAPWLEDKRYKLKIREFNIKIRLPYEKIELHKALDKRCGWYTHYVCADVLEEGVFKMVGILSEPLR